MLSAPWDAGQDAERDEVRGHLGLPLLLRGAEARAS